MGLTDDAAKALHAVTGALPAGEVREGQARMADAVGEAIEKKRHLIVQAGTGTGKTLAYLVPAILSGGCTVVATATKNLQDQVAGKDLPFLTEQLDADFTWAVLKGRSNYLCRQRLKEIEEELQLGLDDDVGKVKKEVTRLKEWAASTDSGERSTLDFEPSEAAWAQVSVSALECPGAAKCPSGATCFAEAARNVAAESDVIVVNTHLYGTHLAAGRVILPEHDLLVVDEAHRLEEVISSTAGVTMTSGRFANLARTIGAIIEDDDLRANLLENGTRFAEAIAAHRDKRVRRVDGTLRDAIELARLRLERANAALRAITSENEDVVSRKARAQKLVGHMAGDLDVILDVPDTDVSWVEGTATNPVLRVAPVDVAPYLRDRLWPNVTSILTSATIPAHLAYRIGLAADEQRTIDVGSPFDYEHQALLYYAAHLPEPRFEKFGEAVEEELVALIEAAGGRTLALFTSHRALQAAVEALRERVEHPIFAQGDLPKPALVEAFSSDPAACLFATMGFWEGLDVPGPSLSLVTIDKLPFPRPDDPLLQAKRDLARQNAFEEVDLPRATTLLAQGVGRLIRTATDRGVVAIFDRRLAEARYRWTMVNALPPMRRTRKRADAMEFLEDIAAEHEAESLRGLTSIAVASGPLIVLGYVLGSVAAPRSPSDERRVVVLEMFVTATASTIAWYVIRELSPGSSLSRIALHSDEVLIVWQSVALWTGLAAVVGNLAPFYRRFRGGSGLVPAMTLAVMYAPWSAVFGLTGFSIGLLATSGRPRNAVPVGLAAALVGAWGAWVFEWNSGWGVTVGPELSLWTMIVCGSLFARWVADTPVVAAPDDVD